MSWYYAEGDQRVGPVTDEQLQGLVASGTVTDATMVWREGMKGWVPFGTARSSPAGFHDSGHQRPPPKGLNQNVRGDERRQSTEPATLNREETTMSEQKGFIASLFDISFTEFVTTRIVKLLFILGIIAAAIFPALAAISTVIAGFSDSSESGIVAFLLALLWVPLVFFVYVLLLRMWLEMIIVIFRIAENTGRLVEQNRPE